MREQEHQQHTSKIDLIFVSPQRREESLTQPYREDLRGYLSTLHRRTAIGADLHSPDILRAVEDVERRASQFLKGSDTAARYVAEPEFQKTTIAQKSLRGPCAVAMSMCIDGRMAPILIAGQIIDVSETKGGLIPVSESPLDGSIEISSARLTEAILSRPQKANTQLLQFNTAHSNMENPEKIDCLAVLQMIERGTLPQEETMREFMESLDKAGYAIGTHYNNAARLLGMPELRRISAPSAIYDTSTAGFLIGAESGMELFTTDLTKEILASDDGIRISKLVVPPGIFSDNFTDPATLAGREKQIRLLIRLFLSRGTVFNNKVDFFLQNALPDNLFSPEQQRAFKFFVARNVALQYTTGLYEGGEHPLKRHNEQYISFSQDGSRVGQFDPQTQSFGASVSDPDDAVDHLKTKVSLMDSLKKSAAPHIAFFSISEATNATYTSKRSSRAGLRSTMNVIYRDEELLNRIKSGTLVVIPVILEEKTRTVKEIPNLAL